MMNILIYPFLVLYALITAPIGLLMALLFKWAY